MKKINSLLTAIVFYAFVISFQSCQKKKEDTDNNDCKTCKAFASGDKPEATAEVCSNGAETTFRSQHTGQEISCN